MIQSGSIVTRKLDSMGGHHFGIYIGPNKIVDYGGDKEQKKIRLTSISEFLGQEQIIRVLTEYPPIDNNKKTDAALKAEQNIGELFNEKYHIATNNCEKFVCWCYDVDHNGLQATPTSGYSLEDIRDILRLPGLRFKSYNLVGETLQDANIDETTILKTNNIENTIDILLNGNMSSIEELLQSIQNIFDDACVAWKMSSLTHRSYLFSCPGLYNDIEILCCEKDSQTLRRNSFDTKITDFVGGLFSWFRRPLQHSEMISDEIKSNILSKARKN